MDGGPPQTVVALPFQKFVSWVVMAPERFVCDVAEVQGADVWLAENFDPGAE